MDIKQLVEIVTNACFLRLATILVFPFAIYGQLVPINGYEGWSEDGIRANREAIQQQYRNSVLNVWSSAVDIARNGKGSANLNKDQLQVVAKGRARIKAGQASVNFKPWTLDKMMSPAHQGLVVARQTLGATFQSEVSKYLEEVRSYGYATDNYVDMIAYGSAVIYEADFGSFPSRTKMVELRKYLQDLSIKGELVQGYYEIFDRIAYQSMADALMARKWVQIVKQTTNSLELENAVQNIEGLDNAFYSYTATPIYEFSNELGAERKLKKGSSFERRNKELAREWYEKECVRRFARIDLDYAVLLKEFDALVEDMNESTNDLTSGELVAAALVYEVYLDSTRTEFKLNKDHLRDLRKIIEVSNTQPYVSEIADIWRQRSYEIIATRGMFINKAYFTAKTAAQKKALSDEALRVLGIVFRGKIDEYYIDANGIGKR